MMMTRSGPIGLSGAWSPWEQASAEVADTAAKATETAAEKEVQGVDTPAEFEEMGNIDLLITLFIICVIFADGNITKIEEVLKRRLLEDETQDERGPSDHG